MIDVLIRPRARQDIKKIWLYTYENYGERQADIYVNALAKAIDEIPENPKIGRDIGYMLEGYRLYHFERHLVIYNLSLKSADVVRVLGESMDIERHL